MYSEFPVGVNGGHPNAWLLPAPERGSKRGGGFTASKSMPGWTLGCCCAAFSSSMASGQGSFEPSVSHPTAPRSRADSVVPGCSDLRKGEQRKTEKRTIFPCCAKEGVRLWETQPPERRPIATFHNSLLSFAWRKAQGVRHRLADGVFCLCCKQVTGGLSHIIWAPSIPTDAGCCPVSIRKNCSITPWD